MSGQYYIYIPWNDADFIKSANSWATIYKDAMTLQTLLEQDHNDPNPKFSHEYQQRKDEGNTLVLRKIPIISVHGSDVSKLANILPADTLYVLGHCSAGSDAISNNNDEKLLAKPLIQQMIADGVPQNIKEIKLWNCEGGKGTFFDDTCFGSLFYEESRKNTNFPSARITAYKSSLKTINKFGRKRGIKEEGMFFWAKEIEVRASSEAVHWPP